MSNSRLQVSDLERVLYMAVFSIVIYLMVLAIGYVWARSMHYPFTLRQRKMWNYYVLSLSALPVLGPLMVALGRWLLPVTASIAITVFLLAVWLIIVFYLVRRMSKPGGRLSMERSEAD
jgi:hypothetical protein